MEIVIFVTESIKKNMTKTTHSKTNDQVSCSEMHAQNQTEYVSNLWSWVCTKTLTWLAGSEEQNPLLTAGLTYTKERSAL